jgi:hypothetical protein
MYLWFIYPSSKPHECGKLHFGNIAIRVMSTALLIFLYDGSLFAHPRQVFCCCVFSVADTTPDDMICTQGHQRGRGHNKSLPLPLSIWKNQN